jgi:hypothetical protein
VSEKFEQWANCELMGHQRVVGRCSEELIAGHPMLRVDIPDGEAFTTRYYGSSAIYCLTVISEDVARKICSRISQVPSFAWDLREHPKAIGGPATTVWDDDDQGGEAGELPA